MCTDGAYSYLSRLEQRLEDIETNLAQLRQFQHASQHNIANSATTTTPYQAPMQAPAATDDVVPPQASPQLVSTYSTNTELGEVDTSEDAIDGMGAIKFTDEQDSGYFGKSSIRGSDMLPCSPFLQARPPTSLSCAISRWPWLRQVVSLMPCTPLLVSQTPLRTGCV
jgi:hypothetical protein